MSTRARGVPLAGADDDRLLLREVAYRDTAADDAVSVDLQRSSTSHLVPTTVAALCLPLVRNLPSPSPHRRRFFLRFAAMLALPAFGQLSFSVSERIVVGFLLFV